MSIFKQHLFVANFGDGIVNAFDRCSGRYIGSILTKCNTPLVIEGVKGILLLSNEQRSSCETKKKCESCDEGFVYTAGINNETSGVVGTLKRCC